MNRSLRLVPSPSQEEKAEHPAEKFISPTVTAVPPSGIRKFFDLISQTEGVISLGVGEPDFATPWHIREAALYNLERGRTNYTANAGLPELRQAINRYLLRKRGLSYHWKEEILVTVGASEAIDLALRSVLQKGDEVVIPEPTFVSYSPCTRFAGGTPVPLPLSADQNFQISREQLLGVISPRTKIILICSPNNPTGSILNEESLRAIADVAREFDLLVIADEIYSELTYGQTYRSIATFEGMQERTVVVSGLSKSFAMTGWRIGYAAGPAPLIAAMNKIHQYSLMCAPTLGQMAAVEALENGEEQMQQMVQEYGRRRRVMLEGFRRMGLDCFEAQGAFYLFPSIKKTGLDDEQFAARLLAEEKVAVVPGSAFGRSGSGHIRCSYATSLETLQEALKRMGRFVRSL